MENYGPSPESSSADDQERARQIDAERGWERLDGLMRDLLYCVEGQVEYNEYSGSYSLSRDIYSMEEGGQQAVDSLRVVYWPVDGSYVQRGVVVYQKGVNGRFIEGDYLRMEASRRSVSGAFWVAKKSAWGMYLPAQEADVERVEQSIRDVFLPPDSSQV